MDSDAFSLYEAQVALDDKSLDETQILRAALNKMTATHERHMVKIAEKTLELQKAQQQLERNTAEQMMAVHVAKTDIESIFSGLYPFYKHVERIDTKVDALEKDLDEGKEKHATLINALEEMRIGIDSARDNMNEKQHLEKLMELIVHAQKELSATAHSIHLALARAGTSLPPPMWPRVV